jgi:hypothetical protein
VDILLFTRRAHRFLGLVLLIFFGASRVHTAQAQDSGSASISGYVLDSAGFGVGGAIVRAEDSTRRLPRLAVSDAAGYYILPALSVTTYTVSANAAGFSAAVREGIEVRTGLALRLDLVLIPGAPTETVVVRGEAPPLLEWKRPAHGVVLRGALQSDLPGSGLRGWSDFLLNGPGVVTSQARFQTYSLYGTSPASGVVLVDGADATSVLQGSTLYSQFADGTFEDVAVKTAGNDVSVPLGLGPISLITTRSGSDVAAGELSAALQPKSWNDRNTPNGQDLTVETRQVDLSAGGPLWPKRAWLFGSLRVARNATGVPRSAQQLASLRALAPEFEPFPNPWKGQAIFLKASGRVGTRHWWQVSGSGDVFAYGGAQPNEAGLFRDLVTGGPTASGRMTSVWQQTLLTTVTASYNGKQQQTRSRTADRPGTTVQESVLSSGGRLLGTGVLAAVDGSPFPGTDFDVHMSTFSVDAAYVGSTRIGTHEMNGGFFLQPRRDRRVTEYSANGFQLEERVLVDPANPSGPAIPFHRQYFDSPRLVTTFVDITDTAVYLQDSWRPASPVTINAGIRIDRIRRFDRRFDVVAQRSTEIGSRVGITVALDDTAQRVIYGGWGRAFDNPSQNPVQAGTNVSTVRDMYDTSLDGSFDTTLVTPGRLDRSSNVVIDLDHFHQPSADETLLGLRQQFRGISVDFSFVHRRYRRPTAVEINGRYEGDVFVGYRDETQNQIYEITDNRWNWPTITALEAGAAWRADRLDLVASASRQWDWLRGTWQPNDPAARLQPASFANADGIGVVTGCTTGGVTCPDGDSLAAGFGGTWRAYVAHGSVSYRLGKGISLAAITTVQAGPWSGPIQTRLPASDPAFGPATVTLSNGRQVSNPLATVVRFKYPTREQGQLRLPPLVITNLRVGWARQVAGVRAGVAIDILNLLNNGSDQGFQLGANQEFSALYSQAGIRQFPRSVLLSARLWF